MASKLIVEKDEHTITGVQVKLSGTDGNAYAIMGLVKQKMKDAGIEQAVIDKYLKEAKSGDYDHLLQVTMQYVIVS